MTRKTRNFVVGSLVVLVVGLGTGLVAYYGFPTSAFSAAGGPDELRFLPANTNLVAFADVHQVMTSELRQKLRRALPFAGDRQQSFLAETGIDIERDIDRLVFGVTPSLDRSGGASSSLALARGRFDAVRIDAFLREKGAAIETYKGRNVFTLPERADAPSSNTPRSPGASRRPTPSALTFLEPGLVAVGSAALVHRAVDLRSGGDSVVTNDAVMTRVRELEQGNVWVVGRFDALTAGADLAQGLMGQLPAITWFSASGQVDAGVRGALKAETRDEESATALRDLVRGFFALAKLQGGSRSELQSLLQTVQLGGTGQIVTLSLDLSPQTLDALTSAMKQLPTPVRPAR